MKRKRENEAEEKRKKEKRERREATNATETDTETKTAWNQGTGMQPSAASWRAPPRGEAPRWPKRRVRPSGSSNNNTEDQRVNYQARGNPATTKRPNKYKRELCNTWTETGTCPYGQRCQYAHGEAELRVEEADKPSAYKTVRCESTDAPDYTLFLLKRDFRQAFFDL